MSTSETQLLNTETITAIVATHGYRALLRALPDGARLPYAVLRRAVRDDGTCLGLIAPGDRTPALCLAAVQSNGCALRWVPERLLDTALCRVAIRSNPLAIREVPGHLMRPELIELAGRTGCPPVLLPGQDEAGRAVPGRGWTPSWESTRATRRGAREDTGGSARRSERRERSRHRPPRAGWSGMGSGAASAAG